MNKKCARQKRAHYAVPLFNFFIDFLDLKRKKKTFFWCTFFMLMFFLFDELRKGKERRKRKAQSRSL